ncbi:MAG: glycosyltransferase family 2 protein [Opitutales bacterium]
MFKISIIITNYNHSHCLNYAVESAINQSRKPDEVLIIDDGSTDNSKEVIQSLEKEHSKVRAIYHNDNKGTVSRMNEGTRESIGDYLVYRAADDISYPGFFEKAIDILMKYPEAAFCCGDIIHYQKDPKTGQRESLDIADEVSYFSPEILPETLGSKLIYGQTIMVSKEKLVAIGGFHIGHQSYCDWFSFLVLAFKHGICYAPEIFAGHQLNSFSYSAVNVQHKERQRGVLKNILLSLKNDFPEVIPHFIQSGALDLIGPQIVEVIYHNLDLLDPITLALIQMPLARWVNQRQQNYLTDSLGTVISKVLDNHIADLRKIIRRGLPVLVYGTGGHSERVARIWHQMNLSAIHCYLCTFDPDINSFHSTPVHNIEKCPVVNPGLIIISSMSYEEVMFHKACEIFPDASKITFWNQELTQIKPIS